MEQNAQAGGLPRALDVQRFAGAREQEIRALVSALQSSRLGAKFGVAAMPRHLRRRAGSHKPYHAHRLRPNLKLQGKRRKLNPAAGETDAPGEGPAAEGEAAGAAEAAAAAPVAAAVAARPFTNRRMRRQPALLQQQHRESAAWTEAALDAAAGGAGAAAAAPSDGGSGDSKARRLETHVWHAKRLAMEERYGWLLPAGAAGQGRGSRSFLHVCRASALMHDASYLCPLLLRGVWSGVYAALSTLLDPGAAASLAAGWQEWQGSSGSGGGGGLGWEQEVMLHHPGSFPSGGICAAQLLLCPPSAPGSAAGTDAMDADAPGGGGSGEASMQACLWVHPAAAAEAHAALRQAAAGAQVSLSVLNMRRLELRGGAASTVLAVALAGATASGIAVAGGGRSGRRRQQRGMPAAEAPQEAQQGQQGKQGQQGQQEALPPPPLPPALVGLQHGDAVQLLLPDPRLCKPVALGSTAGSLLQPRGAAASAGGQDGRQALDLARLPLAPLPLTEAELSSRRQQLRRRMLQLEASPAGGSAAQQQQQQQQDALQAEVLQRGYCPAVLVRQDPPGQQGAPGWSLILPPGWVPAFWLAAAYAGCKPAGQREWRWLHTLQGRPCFPWDHPDTAAYAALMHQQTLLRLAAAAGRPKAKQQLAAPAPPPDWHPVLRGGGGSAGGRQQQQQQRPPSGTAAAPEQAEQQQQATAAMEVDAAAPPAAAAAAAAPARVAALAGASSSSGSWYVARSYSAMAAALRGDNTADASASGPDEAEAPPSGGRPVVAALQRGALAWRPRRPADLAATGAAGAADTASGPAGSRLQGGCLLEASVQPIKTGTAAEGAQLCFIAGREGERLRTPVAVLTAKQQRRRQREAAEARAALAAVGGDPSDAVAAADAGSSGWAEVGEEQVQVFGYVLSEAPRGAPRACGALAAVAAPAAWRLRALQHPSPRQDGGAIEALARNPGSAALFPVRLRLLAERA